MKHRIARVCVVAAVTGLALAGLASVGAQEAPTARPDVFRSSASSLVVSALVDREALIPVPEAFRFIALDGIGTYESSNQTARASVFYPGNAVISGPNLACGSFGGQFPPEFAPIIDACLASKYPLTVFADSLNPDGTSAGAAALGSPEDPVSGEAVRAVAHAAIDSSTTDAAMNDLRVLGLPVVGPVQPDLPVPGAPELDPTLLTVESATSTTDQRIDAKGVLVVDAEAVLQGVRLIGGLVEIGSIRSTAHITDDGNGKKTRDAALDVSGVTVGGVPAQITEDGLVVGSPTGADGPLIQQLTGLLNEVVGGLGLEITTLAVEDGEENGVAFARSGGLLVEFDIDAQGLPILPGPTGDIDPNGVYQGVMQLGDVGATGISSYIPEPVFTPGGPSTPDDFSAGLPVDAGDGFVDGGGSDFDPGSGDESSGPATEVASPDVPGSPTASSSQQLVSFAEELYAGRLKLVYLAFTLMTLAICLAPRFAMPARLPRSDS